jgi:hypothetical protein
MRSNVKAGNRYLNEVQQKLKKEKMEVKEVSLIEFI